MTTNDTEILAGLVRARHACLTQLHGMVQRQFELIEQGNITALLDVLSVKQRPLADLQRIERALDPFRQQNPDQRQWPSPAHRAACAQQVAQCDALLREILRQESQCEEILSRQRDETAEHLKSFQLAGRASGAYVAAAHVELSQIDLASER